MKNVKFALAVAVLTAPVALFSLPALAATAHNSETGARTSNAADTAATAYQKQVQANGALSFGQFPLIDGALQQ